MFKLKKIFVVSLSLFLAAGAQAQQVYKSDCVRITLIDEGTLRLEYAPSGKFVDEKSFVAVERQYDKVDHKIKENDKQLVLTTSKLQLTYKKGNGPFTSDNLSIVSQKSLGKAFRWQPGMKQEANLKGTYRTLDGYNGECLKYDNNKAMPIEDGILAKDGWTLIDDSKGLLFDGDKDWDWVKKRNQPEGAQDWYFMAYGHDYKAALKSYTRFAGKMPLPPRYTFGYWWSRYWSYSDQDFRNLISKFKQYDLPLDVLVIDMDWHPISEQAGGGWTGWDWNESLFPDYKQFLQYLDNEGVKATMNLHPADGVRPFEKKYEEFTKRLGITDGKAHEWEGSNKQYVKALFETYLHPYMKEGVDFWWLDWQQWLNDKKIPELSNTWWCNYLFFTDMERMGEKRPMLYHRWGGLGNHRYQIGFSGDSYITWESLDFLPYFNSTASNVLYGYWSHDIGGHQSEKFGTPVPVELYTRAMQMGAYLPVLRTHSTKDAALNKEPWAFDNVTQERLANVINGRYAMVPYIYTMCREAYEEGISLCRPLYYDYPEDEQAYSFRNEYMFGDQMLIAPVTKAVNKDNGLADVKVWLPKGQWFEYETGTMIEGGKTLDRKFSMDEYPVYIKAGSILPYYDKVNNLNGTDQTVIVRVFPGGKEGKFSLYEDNGADCDYATQFATTQLSYKREANNLNVKIEARKGQYKDMPAKRHYKVAMPCAKAPKKVMMAGKELSFTYDGLALEACIDLGAVDCSKDSELQITYATDNEVLTDGLKGDLHRIQTAVADYKQQEAGMVYTDAMGYLETTPLHLSYHPDRQDETLAKYREYRNDLPIVLLEQMHEERYCKRFMSLMGIDQNDMFETISAAAFKTADGKNGFNMSFFDNMNLEGEPVAKTTWDEINMSTSDAPYRGLPKDGFSLRAESNFTADFTGEIFLSVTGDDGYRLFVDDKQVIADWTDHVATTNGCRLRVEKGKTYKFRLEFFDKVNEAVLKLVASKTKK